MPTSSRIQHVEADRGDALDAPESGSHNVAAGRAGPPARPGLTRMDRIRLAAYSAAERRGFAPGHEESDWMAAERQVDAQEQTRQDSGAAA